MFKTEQELKNFIVWCKENKLKTFKNKEIEFELSELSFIPDNSELKEINLEETKTLAESTEPMTQQEYDDLLFHSSN